ncbi:P-loop containing nucleoside triphosphate hydrolase protein [Polyporus arcularius HHB13444]|uniref:DNA 3'-5' helicase n=1 Tax=Polyporus arcularius HHB13444 TaxID=1314778 RepID=A0A5C3NVQ5_9APHY|nr:P-loop containing nucleoside triphosphate hydrolase protein [Polyporus arcularius HHB13444]
MAPPTPCTPPSRIVPLGVASPDVPDTPRRRKQASGYGLQGTKRLTDALRPESLSKRLKKRLKLPFDPDPWQLELLSRLLRGFDAILCAGTGYGKSLIFEGLVVLGRKGKVVIVICPLKALERDQMEQANGKGLVALAINEDNSHELGIWEKARRTAQLLYLSPEMPMADGFARLWQDASFRKRLGALIVDEAHRVEEWGVDKFRPIYRDLCYLRHYTGFKIPFLGCTATARTLQHVMEESRIQNTKNPVLDLLNILPPAFTETTARTSIPKIIIYFDSENACREAVDTLRKCLPSHLRNAVYSFSSILSVKAKTLSWSRFSRGELRIVCTTDAAGMGCNAPNIVYIVTIGAPKSLSVVAQQWGRAGRDRKTQAVCLLLMPKWAFRPALPPTPAAAGPVQRLKGKKKDSVEPKSHTLQHAKLPKGVEEFINLGSEAHTSSAENRCLHAYLRETFAPETELTTYSDLTNSQWLDTGNRSNTW